jgi:serine phosphatase RsbU (regulator of sigma subunit)
VGDPHDAALLRDLARVAGLAIDNARLYQERSSIALALQEYLLPASLPQAAGLEFGASYVAAGEGSDVGGDFYDVFPSDHGWGIAIGDVCGKGAPAAAITGMARDVVRVLLSDGAQPAETLTRLNASLLALGERGRFCTAMLGKITVDEGGALVCLTNAGHPPPVLVSPGGTAEFVGTTGTLLGVLDDVELVDDVVRLSPGESLVLYTDGVTERRGRDGMFGDDRLIACLRSVAGLSAPAIASALEAAVQDYGRDQPGARDDLAVLVLQVAKDRP